MWKPGQLVTINGSVYRIQKCKYSSGYKACMFCTNKNIKTPCIEAFDYPTEKMFDLIECKRKMPSFCIPVKISRA